MLWVKTQKGIGPFTMWKKVGTVAAQTLVGVDKQGPFNPLIRSSVGEGENARGYTIHGAWESSGRGPTHGKGKDRTTRALISRYASLQPHALWKLINLRTLWV